MKILVVDDEQDICEILRYNLETEGYEVSVANSAEEGLRLVLTDYSLILLDVMMDGMSGFHMARLLKNDATTCHIPIIFITALDQEDDVVKGLNIGADDYIAKPLSLKEVKARVKAILRRTTTENLIANHATTISLQIIYKDISINLDSKTVTLSGEDLNLTKLEFELLALLVGSQGKVFSREELLQRCWPKDAYAL